jgi:glycosyltransferase involved in cell wall biosynthesis
MIVKRIVFWEPSVSPHKVDFYRGLLQCINIDVVVCAAKDISDERKSMGWSVAAIDNMSVFLNPEKIKILEIISFEIESTLHIFSGLRHIPMIVNALGFAKKNGVHFALYHEPRVREGWKGELRFLQSWLTEGWFRKNAEFVLAIGRNGPPWFTSVGYPADRVLPFAYFVDPPKQVSDSVALSPRQDDSIQIGYVGRLVKMKGVFDLVVAVAKLGKSAKLRIVGMGPDEQALKALCKQLHLEVDFLGVLPITEVGIFMSQLDVLVLASTSKDDGWGVVVSEALMCGTAVIATPCVGASVVLDAPMFGRCVPANAPDAIAQAVQELTEAGAFSEVNRLGRRTAARQLLSADAGARHLRDILQWRFAGGVKPLPFYKPGAGK